MELIYQLNDDVVCEIFSQLPMDFLEKILDNPAKGTRNYRIKNRIIRSILSEYPNVIYLVEKLDLLNNPQNINLFELISQLRFRVEDGSCRVYNRITTQSRYEFMFRDLCLNFVGDNDPNWEPASCIKSCLEEIRDHQKNEDDITILSTCLLLGQLELLKILSMCNDLYPEVLCHDSIEEAVLRCIRCYPVVIPDDVWRDMGNYDSPKPIHNHTNERFDRMFEILLNYKNLKFELTSEHAVYNMGCYYKRSGTTLHKILLSHIEKHPPPPITPFSYTPYNF